MIGHLTYAAGSPCPTFVLEGAGLPAAPGELLELLTRVRRYLVRAGGAHVLKMVLVEPSTHPMFDLEYRFVQALPGAVGRFDLHGSCGHSVLGAVAAAERAGMVPRLTPGSRIRVHVRNNDDQVVCEAESVARDSVVFTVHLVCQRMRPVTDLLLTGAPRTFLNSDGERHEVSLVSAGNPYVFVDARSLDVRTPEALFTTDEELFARMVRIRLAAADRLSLPREGAFPKAAAVLPAGPGRVAARSISVPSWHPTIALNGAICLAAALRIPGTITAAVAAEAGVTADVTEIVTPGGSTSVVTATGAAQTPALRLASVGGRRVDLQGSFLLESFIKPQHEEISRCLALSTIPA